MVLKNPLKINSEANSPNIHIRKTKNTQSTSSKNANPIKDGLNRLKTNSK
tara:strand:- start:210 stop:359 length:150 start_codon:yes stop_codon:yes gene_type:complete